MSFGYIGSNGLAITPSAPERYVAWTMLWSSRFVSVTGGFWMICGLRSTVAAAKPVLAAGPLLKPVVVPTMELGAGVVMRWPGMLIFIIGRPYSVISAIVFWSMPVSCAVSVMYCRLAATSACPMETLPV